MDKRTTIIAAAIGAVAVIIAAIIAILPQLIKPEPIVPTTGLEAKLSKANIILSEVDGGREQVRQWLESDPQYQAMARSCLAALAGKRVIDPIPLDVITSKYRILLGGDAGTNFPSDHYSDMGKVKIAIFETWRERHKDFPQKSFDEIIE